ncbi:MAG TPA: hypothetical protein VHI99_18315 [Vicinamibacterales bacterium]|jgi:hypothetical protein|nr:hypothetical protein [Vicinamibacterales bacterium]
MAWKASTTRFVLVGSAAGLVVSLIAAADRPAVAQGKTIEGAWIVQVSQRDCVTQEVRGTFSSLVTFDDGGTIYESPGGVAFAPGQRSTGHGTWARLGASTFRQRMVAQILFTTPPNLPVTPGFDAGWQVIDHTVTLTDPDHATSAGGAEFYRSDGSQYRSTCSTAVLQRFE